MEVREVNEAEQCWQSREEKKARHTNTAKRIKDILHEEGYSYQEGLELLSETMDALKKISLSHSI